jgi:two-component system chemotaxis response regulator CheB
MAAGVVVRVVICDDSVTYAAALTRLLEGDPDIKVVAICSGFDELTRKLPAARADLVTMDIELAGPDGVHATKWIMRWRPMPIVVLSAHAGPGSAPVSAALAAGALDAVDKSALRVDEPLGPAAVALRQRVKQLARSRARSTATASLGVQPTTHLPCHGLPMVVGIAASTGGPGALAKTLTQLPADFPLPVLVVQHITVGFAEGLCLWLDTVVALPVRLAVHGKRADRGIWVAPDATNLRRRPGGTLALDDENVKPNDWRPSGDALLTSLAQTARAGAVSVVLTGMGRDGAEGTAAVRAAGGLTIAQDEASSVVYGMPRAAAERGAEFILDPPAIGDALRRLATAHS